MNLLRVQIVLFVLFWVSFAWFQRAEPGWNASSRLALTFALVEHATVQVDAYVLPRSQNVAPRPPAVDTGDLAVYQGHYYSDKILGTSLLGVPGFALVKAAEALRGEPFSFPVRHWLVTALSVALLGAGAGVLLFRLLLLEGEAWHVARFGESSADGSRNVMPGALLITIFTFLGTQFWFYGTLFMSYLPSAFFLLWGLLRFERWRLGPAAGAQADGSVPAPPLFTCGLLLGAAVLCEYLAAVPAAFLALYAVSWVGGEHPWRARLTGLLKYGAGGLLSLAPFFIYTWTVFGRISVPYEYHVNTMFRSFMGKGLMGATIPDPDALVLLTVHPYRGLLIHSPWLLAGLAGLVLMIRRPAERRLGLLGAAVFLTLLLYNSAYYMWWGGWSFGPRHLIPALPFLALGAAQAWWRSPRPGRAAIAVSGLAGIAVSLVVVAVDPQIRDLYPDPRSPLHMTLPRLLDPSLTAFDYPWTFPRLVWPLFRLGRTDANAGQLLGLPPGWPSVAPLLLLWAAGGALIAGFRTSGNSPDAVHPRSSTS